MMARPSWADFPQDLLDTISDSVHEVGGNSAALSLVCQSFRECSQKHLFKLIILLVRGRFFDLRQLVHANPRLAVHIRHIHTTPNQLIEYRGRDIPVAILLGFIRANVPNRTLTLSLFENAEDEPEYPTMPTRYLDLIQMRACLGNISGLHVTNVENLPFSVLFNLQIGVIKSLELHDVSFVPTSFELPPLVLYHAFKEVCHSIISLTLVGIEFIDGNMIYACTRLQKLCVEGSSGVFVTLPKTLPHPRPQLINLTLSNCDFEPVQTLVDKLVDLSGLQSFYDGKLYEPVDELEEGDYRYLPYVLDACKNSLRHLHIRGAPGRPPGSIILSHLPNLSRFSFVAQCFEEGNNVKMVVHLLNILKTIRPATSNVKYIDIHFMLLITGTITNNPSQVRPGSVHLPPVFQNAKWADIRSVLANLGPCIRTEMTTGLWDMDTNGLYRKVSQPANFCDII